MRDSVGSRQLAVGNRQQMVIGMSPDIPDFNPGRNQIVPGEKGKRKDLMLCPTDKMNFT